MVDEALSFYNESDSNVKDSQIDHERTIFDLPNELILRIFSYLDAACLVRKVKLVCQSWNILASDSSLWKSLSFEGKDDMSHSSEVINNCSQLQQLSVFGGKIDSLFISSIAQLPFLRSLSFKFCHILTDFETFKKLMTNAQRLTALDLEGCQVADDILGTICYGKKLKHLNLNHCVHLTNMHLIKILEVCKDLEYLDIDGINFLDEYAIKFIFSICSNTIVSLSLDGDGLSDSAFSQLKDCNNLSKLTISFCDNLSDETLNRIMHLQNLKYLKLRKGMAFSSTGLEKMFISGAMKFLTHLNLSECSLLNDDALISVANCCPDLLSLSLNWCWELTDASLFHLVKKCTKIVMIDLTGVVRLHGTFLIQLHKDHWENLEFLNLEQCGCIEDEELQKLAELHPTMKIFDFWGDNVLAKPK